jgi:hypothetical protein
MNISLPPPLMNLTSFNTITANLQMAYVKAAHSSMLVSSQECIENNIQLDLPKFVKDDIIMVWVGSRLGVLKVSLKGKLLSDDKRLTGKGRMTNKVIYTLQNYYGMAIRQNRGDIYGMKKSIAALIYHCSAKDDPEDRYKFCPRTIES